MSHESQRTVIDEYLDTVEQPHRATLTTLLGQIRAELPGAHECITYGLPTFKVDGRSIAGFAAFKQHCSYFPMSGSVLPEIEQAVAGYSHTRGTLRFDPATPLPAELVHLLVETRLRQAAQ